MKRVDHWLGLPACFFLGLLRTFIRRVAPRERTVQPGKGPLLVTKYFGIGSIMQATPMLRAIRQAYPDTPLIFLTFEENLPLLRRLGLGLEVLTIRTTSPLRFAADVIRNVLALRMRGVQAAVDLEFFSKFSTLVSVFSGAPVRIGFHLNSFWRYSLITHPIYFNYFGHITDVYAQAARKLGAEVRNNSLANVTIDPDAQSHVIDSLRTNGWREGALLLGVNANAGKMSPERRWPSKRFADVLRALLSQNPDLFVVLTGSSAEREHTRSLLDRLAPDFAAKVLLAAGRWSLDEFLAALPLLDGFLTNDSGPMHLAAAFQVPMVSLWGPGRPEFYAPTYDGHQVILYWFSLNWARAQFG